MSATSISRNKIGLLLIATLGLSVSLRAQNPSPIPTPGPFEKSPVLSAAAILQPMYDVGPIFQVRDPVPTYAGSNSYTIDSDFGVFEAAGNDELMRRVREIYAISQLRALSGTQEFTQAAARAAESPLVAAQDLVTNPVGTISGVPRGIWKFLNQAGEDIKVASEGQRPAGGVQNMIGFAKVKRDIALRLGVDPYSTNQVFQKELNKVAWPAFAGGFTVNIGMGAITGGVGIAINGAAWTDRLNNLLRDNNPTDLRMLNTTALLQMGISRADSDAFLNNSVISPTAQTIIVNALGQLNGANGIDEFIRQATTSADEQDALFFQQSAQLMALVNVDLPIATITSLKGLPVCQATDGTVVVPVQWDYLAWTPMTARFISALKTANFGAPSTGFALVLTGVVSPLASQNLTAQQVKFVEKQLPTPLN